MNYTNKQIFVLIVLSFFCLNLFSQNSRNEIRDTVQLNKVIKQFSENIKQKNTVDSSYINHLLNSSLQLQDTTSFFKICMKMSHLYERNGLYKESIKFLKSAQKTLGNKDSKYGELNNDIGNNYKSLNFLIDALDYYFKSVVWYEKFNKENTTIPLGNIADIYFDIDNYEKALEYNQLALSYSLKLTNEKDKLYNLIFDYYRIGSIYHKLDKNNLAEENFNSSLKAARKYEDKYLMLISLIYAIKFYSVTGEYNISNDLIAEGKILLKDSIINQSIPANSFIIVEAQHYLNSDKIKKALNPKDIDYEKSTFLKGKKLQYAANYYTKTNDIKNASKYYNKLIENNQKNETNSKEEILLSIEEKYLNKKLKTENEELINVIEGRRKLFNYILILLSLISCLLILQFVNNRRHKRINNLLKIKTEELENSNLELERFNYISSHDIKTPLREIVSFTNLLERKLKTHESESVHEYLTYIKKGGIRLNKLIESTLEYSKLSHGQKMEKEETLNLNILIDELRESMSNYFKENNAKLVELNHLPNIKAHKASIFVLFQNLIENGIKYNNSEEPTIKIYTKKNQNFYSIYINDNGIGISYEYYNKIFDMFRRLHNQNEYEGSGLGLSICKKIVTQINGELLIESELEKGSTFEIKIPNQLIIAA